MFANYEGTGVGIDALTADVIYQNYSFNSALWMLLFDFVLFFVLGLYLDKIIPSEFGQRLSPCFCFQPNYYRCCRRQRRRGANSIVEPADGASANMLANSQDDDEFESRQMPQDNYEAPPVMCKRLEMTNEYLKIDNLQKTFSGGFQAVRGVNMKMYQD